jgi:hypothetical protein
MFDHAAAPWLQLRMPCNDDDDDDDDDSMHGSGCMVTHMPVTKAAAPLLVCLFPMLHATAFACEAERPLTPGVEQRVCCHSRHRSLIGMRVVCSQDQSFVHGQALQSRVEYSAKWAATAEGSAEHGQWADSVQFAGTDHTTPVMADCQATRPRSNLALQGITHH